MKRDIQLRDYQQRVLDQLADYLSNDSIHIVAPPGSGKTLLGISIIERIQRKTLILVPSLLLKKQWIEALTAYKLEGQLSDQLMEPKDITIATYQDLYSKKDTEATYLLDHQIGFLVLDESHHLKKSWSDHLLSLKVQTDRIQTLALTATPPFDANQREWKNYMELTGTIDEEIAVSELIKAGVLAPYQDYVYLTPYTQETQLAFEQFQRSQEQIAERLSSNQEVTDYLLSQKFITSPLEDLQFIYQHFDLYLSALFYLNNQAYSLSDDHWQVLGMKKKKRPVPPQNRKSLTVLYQYLYEAAPELAIFHDLAKNHWLYENKLDLFPDYQRAEWQQEVPQLKEAIAHIVIKEERAMGKQLCGVLLFDQIKKDVLDGQEDFLAYGVAPAFLELKELLRPDTSLAAICGEFVLIHQQLYEKYLLDYADSMREKELAGYRYLKLTDQTRSSLLALITDLLNRGEIHLLIGTVSLLGEGWNCPAVNTVILGNRAGSYVQTQQIRGRGLRRTDETKLTNIWHIGSVFPHVPLDEQPALAPLLRRLSFIEGLNLIEEPVISTGIERFQLPPQPGLTEIFSFTQTNLDQAKQRRTYLRLWEEALAKGSRLAMPVFVRAVPTKAGQPPQEGAFTKQKGHVPGFIQSLLQGQLGLYFTDRKRRRSWQKRCILQKHLIVTLYQLMREDHLINNEQCLSVDWNETVFTCELAAPYQLKKLFNEQVAEILNEVDTPRYVLKIDKFYAAVPSRYSKNRQEAQRFLETLSREHPHFELIYTKNLAGRKHLMEARLQTLTADSRSEVREEKFWQ
ncbi:hypothetical protein NRIC_34420 [Enterococcus florum]|uniref:Helicase ATP-binding domain-containing protein n=1 Tax=Enterococcus florum TaxID=2480627 RepID=A0A4P5PGJ5_9ENTE|nr:DEAD/DEAH box helicase family protein [Enterococcus florum]GCF95551.1 hypothetical protein NRIC_34420 [Enterococcus florum]